MSINVVYNYTCPEDTEEVIFKPWLGTKHMCACLSGSAGASPMSKNVPNSRQRLYWDIDEGQCPNSDSDITSFLSKSKNKNRNLVIDDCYDIPALQPVIMNQFKGARICGKRGGLPFVNVTRVEKNGKCPKGTVPCGKFQSAENTVCYPMQD